MRMFFDVFEKLLKRSSCETRPAQHSQDREQSFTVWNLVALTHTRTDAQLTAAPVAKLHSSSHLGRRILSMRWFFRHIDAEVGNMLWKHFDPTAGVHVITRLEMKIQH